jgi:hypothetical protein
MTKKIILYRGLSEKKTFLPKDTINTLNKEIIKPYTPKGKWEIQIKIREIQIKNPGNPNKNPGNPNKNLGNPNKNPGNPNKKSGKSK